MSDLYCEAASGLILSDQGAVRSTAHNQRLGFGGDPWRLDFVDGRPSVYTNNLWHTGQEAGQDLPQVIPHRITRQEYAAALGFCWRCDGTGRHGYISCPECQGVPA